MYVHLYVCVCVSISAKMGLHRVVCGADEDKWQPLAVLALAESDWINISLPAIYHCWQTL